MLAKIINKYKEIKKLKETRTEVVCKCFGLTNYDLRDAVNNGCDGIKEVKENTKAGTGCGRCNSSVKIINKCKEIKKLTYFHVSFLLHRNKPLVKETYSLKTI